MGKHVSILDPLRGGAALSVCFYHFACGAGDYLPSSDPVKQVASFGWLGVQVFFVITGFIIPYSLLSRSHRFKDAPGFIIRRLKRLEPPYFACIALVLLLGWLSTITPGFRGQPQDLSLGLLLSHVGYLNAVLQYRWLNPVFWTLAIELQFYFLMAFAYPLFVHRVNAVRAISTLALTLPAFVSRDAALIGYWLPLFGLGIASFQFLAGLVTRGQLLVMFAVLAAVSYVQIGSLQTVAGAATAVAILGCGTRSLPRWLVLLAGVGEISYSLYLVHVPVGGRVINLASRLPESYRYAGIALAFAVSIAFAYGFWWAVESWSQKWAKR